MADAIPAGNTEKPDTKEDKDETVVATTVDTSLDKYKSPKGAKVESHEAIRKDN